MDKKTKSGRKPLYTEPEKMQEAINAYFDWCAGRWLVDQNGKEILDDKGRPILVDAHPPTITGLSLALGFSSRKEDLKMEQLTPLVKKEQMNAITECCEDLFQKAKALMITLRTRL